MTTAQANQFLAKYGVTLTQRQLPGGFIQCTTADRFGNLTDWYAGQTAECVVAACRATHGF
jgi:hypothetical protein